MKRKADEDLEESTRLLTKAKGKIFELNKKTLDIKNMAMEDYKSFVEFKHEKSVAINDVIKNTISTLYKKEF